MIPAIEDNGSEGRSPRLLRAAQALGSLEETLAILALLLPEADANEAQCPVASPVSAPFHTAEIAQP